MRHAFDYIVMIPYGLMMTKDNIFYAVYDSNDPHRCVFLALYDGFHRLG